MHYSIGIHIALFIGVLALSASAIFVKIAHAPSSITAFYRLFFSALILLPFALASKPIRSELFSLSAKKVRLGILAGLLLAIHYVMWFESLNYTSVSSSTVLVSLQPLFSIFLGYCFFQEKVSNRAGFGCLVAIIGSAIIGWGDFQINERALWGDLISFLSAGVIAAYFSVGQILRKDTGVVPYSLLSYISSSVFLAAYALTKGNSFTAYPAESWYSFLGLALICTIGGQFVFNLLLKKVSATAVTMSILGEPIGTCILAYFILSETISLQQAVGIAVIIAGLGIFFSKTKKS
ncbi:MAG: DMT family transporter [Phascolarctobacterium sp.]|nr:DMT family transporter [Phascolarctobacterium sp.]